MLEERSWDEAEKKGKMFGGKMERNCLFWKED